MTTPNIQVDYWSTLYLQIHSYSGFWTYESLTMRALDIYVDTIMSFYLSIYMLTTGFIKIKINMRKKINPLKYIDLFRLPLDVDFYLFSG